MFCSIRVCALALVLVRVPLSAETKELHWRGLQVRARLDAEGALHVVERHAMVFTGDWNGGERVFRVLPGQALAFEELRRIDPDGTPHPLVSGDLSAVDEFAWKDPRTLRWRSRRPSDPPFENSELVYELSYALSGALVKQGSRYLLDHDFAFPDRVGAIERFTLELSLDPAWKPRTALPASFSSGPLPPGRGFVVTASLEHVGAERPVAGRTVLSPAARIGIFAALAAAVAFLVFSFVSRETALGRFAPLASPETIDARWLEANVLSLAPEEAGALWDEKIGAPEVASVLARLAAEKKIETEALGKKLTMRLLVPVERLSGYDHELVNALFFGGRTETDTDAIRQHYKSSGLDPASKIKPGLEQKLKAHPDFQDASEAPAGWPAAALIFGGLVLLALSVVFGGEDLGSVIEFGISQFLWYAIAVLCAFLYRKRIDRPGIYMLTFLWFPALVLYAAWQGARTGTRAGVLLVLGAFLLRLGMLIHVFNVAKIRQGPKRIARRKALASARAHFARELARAEPRLRDAWFPYVVAFGLTREADRWFHAYGGGTSPSVARSSSGGTMGSSSPQGGGWTGGGGAFGGAGASASWALAAGALASGVSAPSSSGGGGGGGGGGGSSGGGGGGGW